MNHLPDDCLRLIYKFVYDDVIAQLNTIKIRRRTLNKDPFRLSFLEKHREERNFMCYMRELYHNLEGIIHVQWNNHVFYDQKIGTYGHKWGLERHSGALLYSLQFSTVIKLKNMLKENQVKGYSKMNKNELIKKVMAL